MKFLFYFFMFFAPLLSGQTFAQYEYSLILNSKPPKEYKKALKFKKKFMLDSAYIYFHKALKIARERNDSLLMSKIYYYIGGLDYKYGYINLAEFHIVKSLQYIPSEIPDGIHKGLPHLLLGNVLKQKQAYDKALKEYNEYRELYRRDQKFDTLTYFISYLNSMGTLYANRGDYITAVAYMDSILQIPGISRTKPSQYTKSILNKGLYLTRLRNHKEAYPLLLEALEIYRKSGTPLDLFSVYAYLSELMQGMKHDRQALMYAHKAREIAEKNKLFGYEKYILSRLIQWDDPQNLPGYFRRYQELENIIQKRENHIKDYSLLTVYETAEKERELARKNMELVRFRKHLTNMLILLAALLFTGAIILYYLRRINAQKKLIERQQNDLYELYREMHHRIEGNFGWFIGFINDLKSALNNPDVDISEALQNMIDKIKSFIEIHRALRFQIKNGENRRHFKLSELTDKIFHVTRSMSPSKKVKLQNLIETDLNLRADRVFLTGLIIHEFINNSFKHAFDENTTDGLISIRLYKDNGDYVLEMKDNGKAGRQNTHKDKNSAFGTNMGLKLIRVLHKQLDVLTRHNKSADRLRIITDNGFGIHLRFKA